MKKIQRKKATPSGRQGFTLIEILIVIGIIGILASVATVPLNNSKKKARDARRIYELKQIQLALEVHANANQDVYPDNLSELGAVIPVDPLTGNSYSYCSSGTSFHLGAVIEINPHEALEDDYDTLDDNCTSGGFSGVATDCSGTGGCQGANCENCYDLGPVSEYPGGDSGGEDPGGEDPGEDPGEETEWSLNAYVYPWNFDTRIFWDPPAGEGTLYNMWRLHITGEFMNYSTFEWESKETILQTPNTNNDFFEMGNLRPDTSYTAYVEALAADGRTVVKTSNSLTFTVSANSPQIEVPNNLSTINQRSHDTDLVWNGSDAAGYIVRITGYFFDPDYIDPNTGNPKATWRDMTKAFNTANNSQHVDGLYIHHTYSFTVEAFDNSGNLSGESSPYSFVMIEYCADGSCSDHEFCFTCPQDCGGCPQPLEYYETDPYFNQYFPIGSFECPYKQ